MPLQPGQRIGPYEVVAAIGAGGMGEVYRARDTKLNRDVALKILPASFASDPERLARFDREAHVLASLNHANIAGIYGVEDAAGIKALALELVEGPTLADRIAAGPIAVDEALAIARQIADAPEAAHEAGVVHRDLKPANIKVRPDGTVKLLDFGLARALESTGGSTSMTQAATMDSPAISHPGRVLGTAAYMSPEQARGEATDRRADIWAFGCVLYEMLTGRRAFDGDNIADTLANVLRSEPDWAGWPSDVPAAVRALVSRCLAKNPHKRISHISTARFALEEQTATRTRSVESPAAPFRWQRPLVIAVLVTAVVTAAVTWLATRPAPPAVTRFTLAPLGAEVLSVSNIDRDLALTPDGRQVVYRAANGTALFVRPIDALQGTRLATGEIRAPFVSPDGRWVGFMDGTSALKKVALTGGPVVTFATTEAGNARGAVWLPDDTVIFATALPGIGLQRVSAGGGEVTVLTRPDQARGERDHWWPEALPGGDAVLYTITASGGADAARIAVLDLKDGTSKIVLQGGSHATYVPTGHLIYASGGAMMAVAFDVMRRETRGTPVPVLSRLVTSSYGAMNVTLAAATGTFAYVDLPGGTVPAGARSLVWVDRQGREEPVQAPPRAYVYPRISPDGTQAVVTAADQEQDLWNWHFNRQALTRLTFDPAFDSWPEWAPDGRRLFFHSRRTGAGNIFVQAADGSGTLERLTESTSQQFPSGVSPDGRQLVFTDITEAGWDILMLALDGTRHITPLIKTRFNEGPGVVSPDGRWLAYQANDTGVFEIYVRPWPNVNDGKWQISTGGGTRQLWARDARELFYLATDGAVMRVAVEAGSSWTAAAPTKLFDGPNIIGGSPGRSFDISPDGRRFLMIREGTIGKDAAPPQMVIVRNWFEELKRLVPVN